MRSNLTPALQSCRHNGLSINDEIAFAKKMNIRGYDIFFDDFMPDDLREDAVSFLEAGKSQGLFYTVHSPIRDYTGMDPVLESLIRFVNRLKVLAVIFHFDRMPLAMLRQIRERIDPEILVAVENVVPDWNEYERMNYMTYIREAVRLKGVTANPDFGHAQINGFEPLTFLKTLIHENIPLKTFHIHDNRGDRDSHLPAGEGIIPFDEIFKLISLSVTEPVLIIEHWNSAEKTLDLMRHHSF
jgi:sugar phosphate isomerase/epimerase